LFSGVSCVSWAAKAELTSDGLSLESAFEPASSGGAGLRGLRTGPGEVQFAAPALPRLTVTAQATVELLFTGTPGRTYTVEASQDLKIWAPLTEVQMGPEGLTRFRDVDSKNLNVRFYRLIPQGADPASR
jgi:hypothetical protein